jgi:hypothetical protein
MDTLEYKKLAEAIGAPNGQAARKRWGRYYEKLTSGAAPKSAAGGRVAKPATEKKKKAPSKKAQPANKSKKPVEEADNATPSNKEVFTTPSKKLQGREDRGSDLKEELTEAEDGGADNTKMVVDVANDSDDDQE